MKEATKLAWAAGFMDGEGSFMITKAKHPKATFGSVHTAVLSASQVAVAPLLALQDLLGGKVYPVYSGYGVEYQWRLHGQQAAEAAKRLLPYLVLKGRQAELLVEFGLTIGSYGKRLGRDIYQHRETLREEIRTLNSKRSFDAERLSEKAPTDFMSEGDATVRPLAN